MAPLSQSPPRRRNQIGRIPEDRHHVGVIGDMSVSENLMLERYRDRRFPLGWLVRPIRASPGLIELRRARRPPAAIRTFPAAICRR